MKQYSDTKWADTKMLNYYTNKIKRTSVHNIVRMATHARIHFQANQPGI
jgi:hypothetical protein